MTKLKIKNQNKNPLWKKISCKCNHNSVETEYPLIECDHCRCEQADNSMPTECFMVEDKIYNKDGTIKEIKKREITEIRLTNCSKFGSVIGWAY